MFLYTVERQSTSSAILVRQSAGHTFTGADARHVYNTGRPSLCAAQHIERAEQWYGNCSVLEKVCSVQSHFGVVLVNFINPALKGTVFSEISADLLIPHV